MTCLYLHSCLLDLLNLSILSLVIAITLISPIITRILGSNGELGNRQQCFPNRVISFRKFWMADITAGLLVVCGSSTGLPLATPGLGLPICTVWCSCFSVWASTFPSQETVNSVFDSPLCEGLFHELSMPLGMDDRLRWKCMRTDHCTQVWSSYSHFFNQTVFPLSSIVD